MPLELSKIPQILTALGLSKDEQKKAMDFSKDHKMFAGKAAVETGLVTEEKLDNALLEQVKQKAEAADKDLQTIADKGHQNLPNWLKPSWGNNGVNKAAENPAISDGVSAAANIATNMVLLTNDKPELAKNDKIKSGVEAATKLAEELSGKKPLSVEESKKLITQAKDGLREAVAQSGVKVDLEKFMDARFGEIEKAVSLQDKVKKLLKAEEAEKNPKVVEHTKQQIREAFGDEKSLREGIVESPRLRKDLGLDPDAQKALNQESERLQKIGMKPAPDGALSVPSTPTAPGGQTKGVAGK